MAFIFDKVHKVIFIESPGYGSLTITIQELIDSIRDWEDNSEGIVEKSIANAYGKQDLGGGSKVGITLELINNWRVQFEAEENLTNAYIIGGNLVAVNSYENDPIKPASNINVVIGLSTAPIIPGLPWDVKMNEYNEKGSFGEVIRIIKNKLNFLAIK